MSASDVAAYHRWRRILRWAEGHEPAKEQRARTVMNDIWNRLLEKHERREIERAVAKPL